MSKNLIIFTHGGGRFANQVTNHAHLIAFQQEYKDFFEVINIAFGPYSSLFERLSHSKIQRIPSEHKRLKIFILLTGIFVASRETKKGIFFNQVLRLIHFIFAALPFSQSIKYGMAPNFLPHLTGKAVDHFDLNNPDTLLLLKRRKITALAGWPIRSWELFQKHQELIRHTFEIRHDYLRTAKKFISDLRVQHDVLVGVMIRQDDYRTWRDGKYFFEAEQYVLWMKQAVSMFPGKKVGFVVASDEPQQMELFHPLNVTFTTGMKLAGNAHFIESFAELSMCDYIMTPPSTFGLWAAFLGNVPILPLCERNQTVNLEMILKNNLFDAMHHPHMTILFK